MFSLGHRHPDFLALFFITSLAFAFSSDSSADARSPFQRVGAWPYGPSRGVGVDSVRNLVFLGSGGVCLILDGNSPSSPTLISDDLHTQGLIQDVAYDQGRERLFLACGEGTMDIWLHGPA